MINRKEILEYISSDSYKPMCLKELAVYFHCDNGDDYIPFVKEVVALEENGDIVRTSNNLFHTPKSLHMYKGVIVSVKPNFAFASMDELEEDIYIAKEDMKNAIYKDYVLIKLGKKKDGKVVQVLSRGLTSIVGEYKDGFLYPDDKNLNDKIYVAKSCRKDLINGHKIQCLLESNNMGLVAYLTKIIGHKNDPGVDIESILLSHEAKVEFPNEVMEYIEAIPNSVSKKEKENRRDLSGLHIVTIDGEDAKDLDDAICVKRTMNGYKLYVSIADVSYYVKETSVLDKEAFERGTSIYMVNKVVPMLPHKLSNGVCSLNEGVDRLTITCEMDFNLSGDMIDYDVYPSWIRSKHRLNYTEVNRLFAGEETTLVDDTKEMLNYALELSRLIRKKREDKGEIELDIPEAKFVVDDEGKIKDINVRTRNEAEMLIEDFMISANETIASYIYFQKLPFVYRVHDKPVDTKIRNFYSIATILGHKIKVAREGVHPKQLQEALNSCETEQEKNIMGMFLLRSMAKAKYQVENIGHFGLASDCYTHFTSPIRRYPDLIVHRLLREYVFNSDLSYDERDQIQLLTYICEQSSNAERKAIEIEREVESLKKAEYMENHIGEVYEGIVSSVISKGIFVELYNTVEGMISFTDMQDDYYIFDDKNLCAIGTKTRRIIRIGDKMTIKVKDASKALSTIDFVELNNVRRGRSDYSGKRKKTYKRKPKSKA